MRRKDREIKDLEMIKEIMAKCDCVRLGFQDAEGLYIVPLNFGFTEEDGEWTIYCHGAAAGRKGDCIRESGYAAFEMDTKHELVTGEAACKYSYLYESIIGDGTIEMIEDIEEKKAGLEIVMNHYDKGDWEFNEMILKMVGVFKLKVKNLSCKAH
ncbi:MAG: pyridoxamine 5'-phosphate oxidase family protein [Clostridia bacterium]|nr:pyridoxamine 5'-phosphate oxidase family protein [Lachnospiraceae bacterium]NCC00474.1 pyridoxamine 5'-phosphate oxidase family protein [Clostridia bacterium]NCD02485.1 pyridoxamine 5'-phosphate oxidase family protein [Clostridia bacterium]